MFFSIFFTFRLRDRDGFTYALSICFRKSIKHYKIDKKVIGGVQKLAIEDGPKFDSLIEVSIKFI